MSKRNAGSTGRAGRVQNRKYLSNNSRRLNDGYCLKIHWWAHLRVFKGFIDVLKRWKYVWNITAIFWGQMQRYWVFFVCFLLSYLFCWIIHHEVDFHPGTRACLRRRCGRWEKRAPNRVCLHASRRNRWEGIDRSRYSNLIAIEKTNQFLG